MGEWVGKIITINLDGLKFFLFSFRPGAYNL
jgi:hypothetical protein